MFWILEGQFASQFRILQKITRSKDFCATLFKQPKTNITTSGAHYLDHSAIGTSDFPRSLYLMWFWFGLENLRLVYKTVFLKYWIVSILFDFLSSKKTAPFVIRVEKYFFKIGRKGYPKKQNYALISKMCWTLASRSSKRFFLKKTIDCKIF